MTPEEFDALHEDDCDQNWSYDLINGVLVVSPIPMVQETDPNEEMGHWLRTYRDIHPKGNSLDKTLPEQYLRTGTNRRRADRVLWAGLGRLPRKGETPTAVVEFVSSRKRERERDYEAKREEYRTVKVQEYWIIDRFTQTMTVHILEQGEYRKKVLHARQTYRTKLLPGFEVPLARLFSLADQWDEESTEDAS
jgi:Uma2 family endonuclease